MCGRYNIIPNAEAWTDAFRVLGEVIAAELKALPTLYNIAPTQALPIVVAGEDGRPALVRARWGFIPSWWSKPNPPTWTTNARADDTARKGNSMWHQPLRHSRCLVPASGWYEWLTLENGSKPVKLPHHIRRADGKQIMFAGLWSEYRPTPESEVMPTFTIMTLPSTADLAEIHEREPVVLHGDWWLRWLDRGITDKEQALQILDEGAVHHLSLQQVSRTVSNARNRGSDCINPVSHPELETFGVAGYSMGQIRTLREQPADEFMIVHQERMLSWESEAERPSPAEVHLWLREARERPDADHLQDFIEACKAYLNRLSQVQSLL